MFFGHYPSDLSPLSNVISALVSLGAPTNPLPFGDKTICDTLPALQSLSSEERLECLQRAKEDVLANHLMRYTEEIRLVAFNGADCVIALGKFTPAAFVGRDNRRTPPKRAVLAQTFYGRKIEAREIFRLTHLAFRLANFDHRPKLSLPDGAVVYFTSFAEKDVVKIGFTSNMRRRLSQFRSISSIEPTIHLTLPGDRSEEQRLHRRFAADRITRELFHFSPAIAKFIAEHRTTRVRTPRANFSGEGLPAPAYSLIPQKEFFSPPNFIPTLLPLF